MGEMLAISERALIRISQSVKRLSYELGSLGPTAATDVSVFSKTHGPALGLTQPAILQVGVLYFRISLQDLNLNTSNWP